MATHSSILAWRIPWREELGGLQSTGRKELDTTEPLHFHFAWNASLVPLIFLKIYLVFLILLFSSISLYWSLRKAFLSLLAMRWNSAFKRAYLSFSPLPLASLLFSVICKASSDNHFAFLHFFSWGWSWSLPPVQCHEPPSIVHQALYQIKSLETICHFHHIIIRDLI